MEKNKNSDSDLELLDPAVIDNLDKWIDQRIKATDILLPSGEIDKLLEDYQKRHPKKKYNLSPAAREQRKAAGRQPKKRTARQSDLQIIVRFLIAFIRGNQRLLDKFLYSLLKVAEKTVKKGSLDA